MKTRISLAMAAVLLSAGNLYAFDAALSNSVAKSAVPAIKACKDGACTAAALKKAAGQLSGLPNYDSISSAMRKVASAVGDCQAKCAPDKAAEAKKAAAGYHAQFAAAKQVELRSLAPIFQPSQYSVLR
jgi:hypothetical protein